MAKMKSLVFFTPVLCSFALSWQYSGDTTLRSYLATLYSKCAVHLHFCGSCGQKEGQMTLLMVKIKSLVFLPPRCARLRSHGSIPEIQSSILIWLHYTQNVFFILHFCGSSAPKEGRMIHFDGKNKLFAFFTPLV